MNPEIKSVIDNKCDSCGEELPRSKQVDSAAILIEDNKIVHIPSLWIKLSK